VLAIVPAAKTKTSVMVVASLLRMLVLGTKKTSKFKWFYSGINRKDAEID